MWPQRKLLLFGHVGEFLSLIILTCPRSILIGPILLRLKLLTGMGLSIFNEICGT